MHTIFRVGLLLLAVCGKKADFSQFDPETTTKIDLSNQGITSIEGIEKFVNVEYLDVSRNQIAELPDGMDQLKKLKVLDIYENKLKKLSKVIEKLESLEEIYAHKNSITELPEIEYPKTLKILNFCGNELRTVPYTIGKLDLILMYLDDSIEAAGNGTTTLGKAELQEKFPNCIIFMSTKSEPIHWNLTELCSLWPSFIPPSSTQRKVSWRCGTISV